MHFVLLLLAFQLAPGDAIANLREQWARNLHDKQLETSLAQYAQDADFINPDASRVHGAAALRELFKTVASTYDSDIVFTSGHIAQSGDMAYDSGTYRETLTVRSSGTKQQITGSYLTVYQRSKGGPWLIVQQMWTVASGSGV